MYKTVLNHNKYLKWENFIKTQIINSVSVKYVPEMRFESLNYTSENINWEVVQFSWIEVYLWETVLNHKKVSLRKNSWKPRALNNQYFSWFFYWNWGLE